MISNDLIVPTDYYTPENFKKIGHNLLFVAATYADLLTVQRLMARSTSEWLFHERDRYGQSALMLALTNDRTETASKKNERLQVISLLLSKIPLDITCLYGKNVLSKAVCYGDADACYLILQQNGARALIDSQDISGLTPAIIAASTGSLNILKKLVEYGADLKKCCYQRATILMHAARHNKEDVLVYLLECAEVLEQINARDQHGEHVLFYALESRNLQIVRILVEYGASLGVKNFWGQSALKRALLDGKKEIADYLYLEEKKQASLIFSSENKHTFTSTLNVRR